MKHTSTGTHNISGQLSHGYLATISRQSGNHLKTLWQPSQDNALTLSRRNGNHLKTWWQPSQGNHLKATISLVWQPSQGHHLKFTGMATTIGNHLKLTVSS
jgi:hypothetical protein